MSPRSVTSLSGQLAALDRAIERTRRSQEFRSLGEHDLEIQYLTDARTTIAWVEANREAVREAAAIVKARAAE